MIFFLYSVDGIGDEASAACELKGSISIRAGMSPHLTGYDITKSGSNPNTQQILWWVQEPNRACCFPMPKPSSGTVGVSQHRSRTPRTATPTCSSCEPLGHVRIKTQARLSDKHRGASDWLWASSSEARVWLNSWEFVKSHSLRLLDSALCYKYLDFLHSLQAATLTLHFSLCAD